MKFLFSVLLMGIVVPAFSAPTKKQIQIRVVATPFSAHEIQANSPKACHRLADLINIKNDEYTASCVESFNVDASVRIEFKTFVDKAKIQIDVINGPKRVNGMSFQWKAPIDEKVWARLVNKFIAYIDEDNIKELEAFAINSSLKLEDSVIDKNDRGQYVNKETNEVITHEETVQLFMKQDHINPQGEPVKRNRHFLRAILEVGGILLTGGGVYQFMDFDEDADFEYTWNGVKEKLSADSLLFDDNHKKYNLYGHPIAGTMYYLIARSNGLSSLEGMLMAFVSSALWEYGPEFAEVSSINDQFQTALTGPAIGEAMFQLGVFFERASGTIMHKILAGIMGPSIHNWLDGYKTKRAENLDRWGFDVDYWHRFNIYSQVAQKLEGSEGLTYQVGFDMQLNTVKGSEQAGEAHKWKWETMFVEMAARLDLSPEDEAEFLFYAKSVYAGLFSKNIKLDEKGRKNGYTLILGPSSSYDLRDVKLAGKDDTVGIVNFLGTTLDMSFFIKDVKIRISLDMFANFSAIRSIALEKYRGQVPDSEIKATLEGQNYSNGLGLSSNGKFEISYKDVGLNVDGKYVMAKSWNGIERNQDKITDDLVTREERLRVDSTLYYNTPYFGLQVGVGHQYSYGNSVILSQNPAVMEQIEENASEHSWFLKVGGQF